MVKVLQVLGMIVLSLVIICLFLGIVPRLTCPTDGCGWLTVTVTTTTESSRPYPEVRDAVRIENAGVCRPGDVRYQWRKRDDWCVPPKPQQNSYLILNPVSGHLAWYNP